MDVLFQHFTNFLLAVLTVFSLGGAFCEVTVLGLPVLLSIPVLGLKVDDIDSKTETFCRSLRKGQNLNC